MQCMLQCPCARSCAGLTRLQTHDRRRQEGRLTPAAHSPEDCHKQLYVVHAVTIAGPDDLDLGLDHERI